MATVTVWSSWLPRRASLGLRPISCLHPERGDCATPAPLLEEAARGRTTSELAQRLDPCEAPSSY
ncbi:hypothetical protein ACFYPZ_38310 [Streptomyces sp. NPDC005506]|uniref:hypothetical protein n=1 Tax=unclassified Streptomyces TaxID=2593676 RepID=UPI0036BCF73A